MAKPNNGGHQRLKALVTETSQWRKTGTRERKRKDRVTLKLRTASFAGNSERQSYVRCTHCKHDVSERARLVLIRIAFAGIWPRDGRSIADRRLEFVMTTASVAVHSRFVRYRLKTRRQRVVRARPTNPARFVDLQLKLVRKSADYFNLSPPTSHLFPLKIGARRAGGGAGRRRGGGVKINNPRRGFVFVSTFLALLLRRDEIHFSPSESTDATSAHPRRSVVPESTFCISASFRLAEGRTSAGGSAVKIVAFEPAAAEFDPRHEPIDKNDYLLEYNRKDIKRLLLTYEECSTLLPPVCRSRAVAIAFFHCLSDNNIVVASRTMSNQPTCINDVGPGESSVRAKGNMNNGLGLFASADFGFGEDDGPKDKKQNHQFGSLLPRADETQVRSREKTPEIDQQKGRVNASTI
ncbi:hypothetical protein EVAR_20180_1 [Eumeta japonica]|uniref:Uncharacterized protein n=1 Tax=Eumeta variegata TaxID=151549 RepID=A0A4C1UTQ9_EUMVA|nr:hypothetical protein EVAR_20180_1 [Eumeta japonica]